MAANTPDLWCRYRSKTGRAEAKPQAMRGGNPRLPGISASSDVSGETGEARLA
jgi:hypothetical protein